MSEQHIHTFFGTLCYDKEIGAIYLPHGLIQYPNFCEQIGTEYMHEMIDELTINKIVDKIEKFADDIIAERNALQNLVELMQFQAEAIAKNSECPAWGIIPDEYALTNLLANEIVEEINSYIPEQEPVKTVGSFNPLKLKNYVQI